MPRRIDVFVHQFETWWTADVDDLEEGLVEADADVLVRLDLPVPEAERIAFTHARNDRRRRLLAGLPLERPDAGVRPQSDDFQVEDCLDLLDAVLLRHPHVVEHVGSGHSPEELVLARAARDAPPRVEILKHIQAADEGAVRAEVNAYVFERLGVWAAKLAGARRALGRLANEVEAVAVAEDRPLRVLLAVPYPLLAGGILRPFADAPGITLYGERKRRPESHENGLVAKRLRNPDAPLDDAMLDRILVEWFLDLAEGDPRLRAWWRYARADLLADGILDATGVRVEEYLRRLLGRGPVDQMVEFVVYSHLRDLLEPVDEKFAAVREQSVPLWRMPPSLRRALIDEGGRESHTELRTGPSEEGDDPELDRLAPIALELTARVRAEAVRTHAGSISEEARAVLEEVLEDFVTLSPVGVVATYGFLETEQSLPPLPRTIEEASSRSVFAWGSVLAAMLKRVVASEQGSCPKEIAAALDACADRTSVYAYEEWPLALMDPAALPTRLAEIASAFALGAALGRAKGGSDVASVHAAVAALPERDRRMIEARYAEGLGSDEVGAAFGVAPKDILPELARIIEACRGVAPRR